MNPSKPMKQSESGVTPLSACRQLFPNGAIEFLETVALDVTKSLVALQADFIGHFIQNRVLRNAATQCFGPNGVSRHDIIKIAEALAGFCPLLLQPLQALF